MDYIVLVLQCEDRAPFQCYEGSIGHHIWRLGVLDGTFERLTQGSSIRRLKPVFGRKTGKIYYLASDASDMKFPVTFIAKESPTGKDYFVFPEKMDDLFFGKKYDIYTMQISKDVDEEKSLILGNLGDGPKSIMNVIEEKNARVSDRFLFENQDLQL